MPKRNFYSDSPLITSVGTLLQKLNGISHFPPDVITEILCRLPVKSLLRFRCVSKPWCCLIDSPHFVKTHLKTSSECKTNSGMIAGFFFQYSVDFDSTDDATAITIDDPLRTRLYDYCNLGSCDGLVCLINAKAQIFLWNPATRKCRNLPPVPKDFPFYYSSSQCMLGGFGYDALSDSYKVVRIDQSYANGLSDSKVTVYSLRTNLWRHVQNLLVLTTNKLGHIQNFHVNYFHFFGKWGKFVNGALHWLVGKPLGLKSCPSIIVFDLKVEKYNELPMPISLNEKITNMRVDVCGECLCILDNYPHILTDVWVMNDYGVGNSWVKLFSVDHQNIVSTCEFVRPLTYSQSCKDVLVEVDNEKIMWYDVERKNFKNVKLKGFPVMFVLEVYTESLVQLGDDSNSDRKWLQKYNTKKVTTKEEADVRN